jgi:hypothetical protein
VIHHKATKYTKNTKIFFVILCVLCAFVVSGGGLQTAICVGKPLKWRPRQAGSPLHLTRSGVRRFFHSFEGIPSAAADRAAKPPRL